MILSHTSGISAGTEARSKNSSSYLAAGQKAVALLRDG